MKYFTLSVSFSLALLFNAIIFHYLNFNNQFSELKTSEHNNYILPQKKIIEPPLAENKDKDIEDIIKKLESNMVKVDGKGRISTFYLNKFEVSQEEWKAVMVNNPSNFPNCSNCPVESVSWYDAKKFIAKINELTGKSYRLPTNEEWLHAARGGINTRNFRYSGSNNLEEVAWYVENSNRRTNPVGQLQPNELGLFDMSGNVWEWCENNRGSFRILRGGGWNDYSNALRLKFRNYENPEIRNSGIGFRIAL